MKPTEYGFWEYTCPQAGACGQYRTDDWARLLDDMAAGGMNSLALVVKWTTTGYHSRYKWLDQDATCRVIATKNAILQRALAMAKARHIRVWLVGVCSYFQVKEFGIVPPNGAREGVFQYDPDYPGVLERSALMFQEIAEAFRDMAGLVVELEGVELDWPHRIPLYNAWAKKHGQPSYSELKLWWLDSRAYCIHAWRDFLTWRRCLALKEIESAVRATGFNGQLGMICETGNEPGSYRHAVNLAMYRKAMRRWSAVTYDYSRDLNRYATTDFCMAQPRAAGLPTYYLGRGVMTYGQPLSISLEENWRRDFADAVQQRVTGLWFFGADAVNDKSNVHCSLPRLRRHGFATGRAARQRLIGLGKELLGC